MYSTTRNGEKVKHSTGACGGLFPLAPTNKLDEEELTEIGYWRKNYKLQDFLFDEIIDCEGEDPNLTKFLLNEDQIKRLVKFAKGEKRYIEETGDDDDGWYDVGQWEYTIKTFNKALRLNRQGNDIYYECWY